MPLPLRLFYELWGGDMAVYFRHGSNGSYKSAYAVWFEVVPALRAGRLVVTNIEGLKSLQGIEELLGEKFPASARLIRIFSRSEEGVKLWQSWFCWMPIGALVVIDECQDLFSADVGFKREKAQYIPVENFKDLLPPDFMDLFYSRWLPVPEDQRGDDGEEDDTGRTQYDDLGRLMYPFNFYGAFMRHRKYQWDVIMLTPDWTSIPTWVRGCAQEAYSHRSTDTFFRKRKPRIFNHLPNSSKTAPTTKADYASCTSKKIPIDVFALYKSTGTGGFNESKADITLLKSPKFIISIVIGVSAFIYFIWSMSHVLFRDSSTSSQEVVETVESSSVSTTSVSKSSNSVGSSTSKTSVSDSGGVDNSSSGDKVSSKTPIASNVKPFVALIPALEGVTAVYLTGVEIHYRENLKRDAMVGVREYYFRLDSPSGSFYLRSNTLQRLGLSISYVDECLLAVALDNKINMITCPPNNKEQAQNIESQLASRGEDMKNNSKMIDIFSM